MKDTRFNYAVDVVLRHEGGYVDDPRDPGGATKYGISKRSYPQLNIKALTRVEAAQIYHDDWWARYGYTDIRDLDLATKVFDTAVNMGAKRANKILQQAVNDAGGHLAEDGVLGPKSKAAVNGHSPRAVLRHFRARQARYYVRLVLRRQSLEKFLNGWLNRALA